jgi:tetratricopeptide (TPR) repeat protein
VLQLTNLADDSAIWQTTDDRSQSVFSSVPEGRYEIEVSAIGYSGVRQQFQVTNSLQPEEVEIVVRRDTSAINPDVAEGMMVPKARRLTKQAITQLKSEKLTRAQKQLDQAHSLTPNSADVNFLLGYLYFRQRDYAKAGSYLRTAVTLNPQDADGLTLLGRTHLEQGDYSAAQSVLEQAELLDFENWIPHNLLAVAYLRGGSYERARDEAKIAITKGKDAASPAHLVVGVSFLETGKSREALEALNVFLEESPRYPMADELRNLVSKISEQSSSAEADSKAAPGRLSNLDPLAAMPDPPLPKAAWQPPGVDEVKPSIVQGISCPFAQVMEQSGKRVGQLVQDVERFAAVEDLLHQNLDNYGIPVRSLKRKYNYAATISEPEPGVLNVDEYRAEKLTAEGYPDKIASNGFAALALVFHPHMSETFAMTCEGLGDWHGHASWLVHFRQRDDRPNRMHAYEVGGKNYPVGLKGRAWITADTFQIVRIEAEIVHSVPDIQLLSEHQIVEYGPVVFAKKQTMVWLPRTAQIYFDLRRHHYYRRHSFEHYMLYSVDSDEKRKEPTVTQSHEGNGI